MTTANELSEKAAELRSVIDEHVPTQRTTSLLPDISPDYSKLLTEVMWGGIWMLPGLDRQMRSLATITAQCVNGWDFGLQHQCRVGLTLGLKPRQIKDIFIQLVFYVGVPATVFGLLQAQNVINERKEWKSEDIPSDDSWLSTIEEKLNRGRQLLAQHWGNEAEREMEGLITHELVPEATALVNGYNFGEVWSRSSLDSKQRTVCILAALMCRGHMTSLKRHISYALNTGLTQREICEVIAQSGWYRGWIFVEEALLLAKEVFNDP
jgi:4-carboxymuconolactone decarboxylase